MTLRLSPDSTKKPTSNSKLKFECLIWGEFQVMTISTRLVAYKA